jgi:hypothetical protein
MLVVVRMKRKFLDVRRSGRAVGIEKIGGGGGCRSLTKTVRGQRGIALAACCSRLLWGPPPNIGCSGRGLAAGQRRGNAHDGVCG